LEPQKTNISPPSFCGVVAIHCAFCPSLATMVWQSLSLMLTFLLLNLPINDHALSTNFNPAVPPEFYVTYKNT